MKHLPWSCWAWRLWPLTLDWWRESNAHPPNSRGHVSIFLWSSWSPTPSHALIWEHVLLPFPRLGVFIGTPVLFSLKFLLSQLFSSSSFRVSFPWSVLQSHDVGMLGITSTVKAFVASAVESYCNVYLFFIFLFYIVPGTWVYMSNPFGPGWIMASHSCSLWLAHNILVPGTPQGLSGLWTQVETNQQWNIISLTYISICSGRTSCWRVPSKMCLVLWTPKLLWYPTEGIYLMYIPCLRHLKLTVNTGLQGGTNASSFWDIMF